MKELYQTLKHFIKTQPLANPEFFTLKCPGFFMKPELDETPSREEKQLCYMDYYQLQQINLMKQIGIKAYL